jgi:hypothetical protein
VPVATIPFLLLSVLVAADLNLSQKSFTAIVVVVCFLHGLLTVSPPKKMPVSWG